MNEQLTSTITWLPVDGDKPPEMGKFYLFTDGENTIEDMMYQYVLQVGLYRWPGLNPTHYAELPTLPTSH